MEDGGSEPEASIDDEGSVYDACVAEDAGIEPRSDPGFVADASTPPLPPPRLATAPWVSGAHVARQLVNAIEDLGRSRRGYEFG